MEYRYSASFLKLWRTCKFRVFCKISEQAQDGSVDTSYGDAGNVVHHTMQYYYDNLYEIDINSALVELEQHFNVLWEQADIQNPKINQNLYWLSVINGVKLKLKATGVEREYNMTDPFTAIAYVDIENTDENWIGDWKTSTYKSSKLKEYKEQLKFYAYIYWKKTGIIPMTWVYFNKVNKIFKYKWTESSLKVLEQEIIAIDKELQQRIKDMDFPRSASRTNCFFCPHKLLCSTDKLREAKSPEYEVTFNLKKHKLMIEGSIPDIVHRKIEKEVNYLVKNAKFIILAMKKRGINYDGIKRLYRRREYGGETTIGYMHLCHRILKEFAHSQGKKFSLTIKDWRNQDILNEHIEMPDELNIPFELYDFQKDAVDALIKYRWGICEIGTGGGKTVIATECIRRLKYRTLFVIDNKDLLMQTKDEYEKMLGVKCGVVGMGQREWDYPIVLSTIQTLAKHAKEFTGELSKFPVVVYDETHIVASKSFEIISKHLSNTKYRFGFSATAKRDDGNDNLIYANSGQVVYKLNAKNLIAKNVLVNPIATFYKYKSEITVTDNWQTEYEDGIVNNLKRNHMIIKLANDYAKAGKQVMVLCKRIKHCEALTEIIEDSKLIYGGTKDDIRYDVLEEFKAKKYKVLVGNISIYNKGLNIKGLDVVINAAGNAGDVVTIQTIGRALRKSPGKKEAFYIDYIDNGDYLYEHSMSRIQALKNEEYTVEIKEWKDYL